MGRGAEAYFPAKHYGEHGGRPNPEHARHGKVSRSGVHRADNLAGPLQFMPDYADGSWWKLCIERFKGHALGWMRLIAGRWIIRTNVYKTPPMKLVRMYLVGISRLLTF